MWHFNPDRPDLTIDRVPFEHLITPAAWIDLATSRPAPHTRKRLEARCEDASVELKPGMTLLYYTGWGELWHDPFAFVAGYPGLDSVRRASGRSTRASSTWGPTPPAPTTRPTSTTQTTAPTASAA